jgi:hypothetical protein
VLRAREALLLQDHEPGPPGGGTGPEPPFLAAPGLDPPGGAGNLEVVF